ncbi:MAG: tripartite tricarboxylate transporter TctB family protein [Pseudomonadota bacterium]|nr:tripartite tricarboxylate transporter TctB family protein [Pseudomonadota bacterium]
MKINDAVWGALLLLLAAAILVHVQRFATIPGQQYGPALFPGVIAVGLAICAVLLVLKGFAARTHGHERARWIEFDSWTRSRRHVLAFSLTIGVNVFYILLVDRLGFIVTGVIYLAALFAVFGVRPRWIIPLAIVLTLAIHTAFYKLLHVPLPWGLLQGFIW